MFAFDCQVGLGRISRLGFWSRAELAEKLSHAWGFGLAQNYI